MRIHISPLSLLLIAGIMALAVACDTTASVVNLTPTPAPPMATPVPAAVKTAAADFSIQLQVIDTDWDKFHQDFNQWQVGLAACDRNTLHVALQDFATGFNEIADQSRALPRASSTRDLADDLIEAAESQGIALRQLRDRWQPENTSLFEAVDTERSNASGAQKSVEDELMDLQQSSDIEDVEAVEAFSTAFEDILSDWESFNDDYNDLSKDQANLDTVAIVDRLEKLVIQFDSIVSAVNDLPSDKASESMAENLQDVAKERADILGELLTTFEDLDTTAAVDDVDATVAVDDVDAAVAVDDVDAEQHDASLFDNADATAKANVEVLEEVRDDIDAVLDDGSAEDVTAFDAKYRNLLATWDAFHTRYDEWRRTDGGCDRTKAIEDLGRFSIKFDKILEKVSDLPQTAALLPIGSLMSEAADREQAALRVLRNSWKPFGADTYKALDYERSSGARQRRQASGSIQDLQSRYNAAQ